MKRLFYGQDSEGAFLPMRKYLLNREKLKSKPVNTEERIH